MIIGFQKKGYIRKFIIIIIIIIFNLIIILPKLFCVSNIFIDARKI